MSGGAIFANSVKPACAVSSARILFPRYEPDFFVFSSPHIPRVAFILIRRENGADRGVRGGVVALNHGGRAVGTDLLHGSSLGLDR